MDNILDRISIESLYGALQDGDMVLTDVTPEGDTVSITAMTLVNAPPQEVWDVVTNYEDYKNFAPLLNKSEVKKREGNKVVVEFAAGIKVKIFSISGHISLELTHHSNDYIEYKRVSGKVKMMEGYWRILDVDNGNKSIMCCKVTADLKPINKALKYLLDHVPFMIGPLLYSGIGIVGSAVKKKVEQG